METKRDPLETETLLRRVRPVAPSEALRLRALARSREAWREAPGAVQGSGRVTLLAPWLAAAAVLALGLFLNRLLVSSGGSGMVEAAALPPSCTESQDGLPGALTEWRYLIPPRASLDPDGWLRERQADLDELLREKPPASQPPPRAPPQAEGRREGTDKAAGATRLLCCTAWRTDRDSLAASSGRSLEAGIPVSRPRHTETPRSTRAGRGLA